MFARGIQSSLNLSISSHHSTENAHRALPHWFVPFAVVILAIASTAYIGCSKNSPVTSGKTIPPTPPNQLTLSFVLQQVSSGIPAPAGNCDIAFQQLDGTCDYGINGVSTDNYNIDSAKNQWRRARHWFEIVRYAYDEFDPSLINSLAPWFNNPSSQTLGFHFIESVIWKAIQGTDWYQSIYYEIANIWGAGIPAIITPMQNSLTDANIFKGLLLMLDDIDNVKLTKLDSNYSRNTLNDVFSNLEGLDTVIGYYVPDSVKIDTSRTDTLHNLYVKYRTADSSMWNAWAADTSIFYTSAFQKQQFEQQYLYPLDTAVANIAGKLGITIQ